MRETCPKWRQELIGMLIRHEGFRQFPYLDTESNLTIGIGRNLDANGVNEDEAAHLLANDINRVVKECNQTFPWVNLISTKRRNVVYSMVFNMGISNFRSFKRMIAAIENKDFGLAAAEMLDSKWRRQVKKRALELAYVMRVDCYPSKDFYEPVD